MYYPLDFHVSKDICIDNINPWMSGKAGDWGFMWGYDLVMVE